MINNLGVRGQGNCWQSNLLFGKSSVKQPHLRSLIIAALQQSIFSDWNQLKNPEKI